MRRSSGFDFSELCRQCGLAMQRRHISHSHSGITRAQTSPTPEQVRRFDVFLDNATSVFFSGDTISGHVRVDLDTCLTLQGITVRLVGEAVVDVATEAPHAKARLRRNKISPGVVDVSNETCSRCHSEDWATPAVPKPRRLRQQRVGASNAAPKFRSSEKYFEHKFYVFGHKYSSRREQLWAGSHQFPFKYTLPAKLPASFHGRFGYVRYVCEAALERAGEPSMQHRALFSVSNVSDLNCEPKAESGAYDQKSTNSCLFCCKKGTVIASAKTKRSGYVPGEEILVSADIINMSDRPVYRTSARLKQVVTYLSSKGFRSYNDEALVSEINRGAIPSGDSDAWDEVGVPVPPVPPTSKFTNCCKLMDIDYQLELIVELENEPLELRLPIWIGTVPLTKEFVHLMPTFEPQVRFPAATHSKYADLPAATGEQCVWGPRPLNFYFSRRKPLERAPGVRTTDRGWTPCYPTYHLQPPSERTVKYLLRQVAVPDIPTIVITKPTGACARHNHPQNSPAIRRHSAPDQLHLAGV